MATHQASRAVDDLPRALAEAGVAGEERALSVAREEAEVLALALAGDREPRGGSEPAHPRLGEIRKREPEAGERLRPQRGQHVGLVLGRVGWSGEEWPVAVVGEAGVMTGGERPGPQAVGQREHRIDPDLPVADDARVRRLPARIAAQEPVDNRGPEALLEIEGQMRDAHAVGERPGTDHRLGRAAAPGSVGSPVRPQL